ncbi:MAG TPA: 1,4-alpha-glucan branching enzyme [Clostridiales bacterium]|nr:MAG: 1,4-alpha-glucan branching enzyme [Clostridiales bacterium GWD2_32_19]HCC07637.1 1,4-alpha-glucan branching enzyme [Clostridiales bacterium]
MKYTNKTELYEIIESRHKDPHNILGMHKVEENDKEIVIVRVFIPQAKVVYVITENKDENIYEMKKIHDSGFFELCFPDKHRKFKYKLKAEDCENNIWEFHDPYSFDKVITHFDLHLFNAGNHYEIYEKLGAHPMEIDGVYGTLFAVWAPNANRVSVVGNFNAWDGRRNQMRLLSNSGVWELFVPGLCVSETYKYEIKAKNNDVFQKADPYANAAELRPRTASVVCDISKFEWKDSEWMSKRAVEDVYNRPMNIYEVHLGSWMRVDNNEYMSYRDSAHKLCNYVKDMGYTHIQLMPIEEYPFDGSWGYQVTGYYAPTSRFGTPDDFAYFVDHMHENGIGVLLDWVPAHFPKDAHGLRRFDGTALYEHEDARRGEHPDWGTQIFNYGRNEVENFLIGNAIFWIKKYHIDGLRVDAVASMLYLDYGKNYGEWVPNGYGGKENNEAIEFMKHMNSVIAGEFPGVMMIAEESTAWTGVSHPTEDNGLGFKYKWNMGWMNDFLSYISKDPIYRKYHHGDLTFSLIYAFTERFLLVLSHDEVVHGKSSMIGKMPGDYWQKFANLRVAYGFMYAHPGKKLLFMGNEFGQFDEWSEAKSLYWNLLEYDKHKQMQDYTRDLNFLYKNEKALWQKDFTGEGFEWIDCADYQISMVSFIRKGENRDEDIVVVCNFTPTPHFNYRMGVPEGTYVEIFNTDDVKYGGSGVKNENSIKADKKHWNYRDYSIEVKVPPLGAVYFKKLKG